MHELILNIYRQSPPGSQLARLPLDDGGLVACWEARAPGNAPPRWIAKTATGRLGVQRLAAEARALARLEGIAASMGIPRLLGWLGAGDDSANTACLLQSGVAGRRLLGSWNPRLPWKALPAELVAASDWLRRFQTVVAPPRAVSLAELAAGAREWACADASLHPEFAPLLLALANLLPPLCGHAGQLAEVLPGVAVHGDFWAGNLLLPVGAALGSSALRIVDWSGFDTGSALHDLLTFVFHMAPRRRRKVAPRMEGWLAAFFAAGRVRDWLRAWAGCRGYNEAAARLAFYLFLVARLSWELGLRLQGRDPRDLQAAHRDWSQLLAWLAQHRFPDPFTPLPV